MRGRVAVLCLVNACAASATFRTERSKKQNGNRACPTRAPPCRHVAFGVLFRAHAGNEAPRGPHVRRRPPRPWLQRGPSRRMSTPSTQLTREIELNIPFLSAAMDSVTEAQDGHHHGSRGRDRHPPQEPSARGPGPRGRAGEARGERHGPGAGDRASPGPVAARGAGHHARARHLRRPHRRGRHSGGHPHRARHPLRAEPRPAAVDRADDEGAGDGHLRASPRSGPSSSSTSIASRSCLVVEDGKLVGLITIKDILQADRNPVVDQGSARGACGSVRPSGQGPDRIERTAALVAAGVDVLVIDTAHGHSKGVHRGGEARRRRRIPHVQVIAGNVATADGTLALIDAGADAVKVGIGPGSICTTRVVAGIGVPQITAVDDCANAGLQARRAHRLRRRREVLGRRVTKAIAAGASTVMIGSLFARHRRSAGRARSLPGAQLQGLPRHGLARRHEEGEPRSLRAGRRSADEKLVPEGIEGRVPYRGGLASILYQLVGGPAGGHGLHRSVHHGPRAEARRRSSSASPRRGSRRATCTT